MAIAIDQVSLGTVTDDSGDSPVTLVTSQAAAALSRIIVVVVSNLAPTAVSVGGTAAARDRTHTNGDPAEVWSVHKAAGLASSSNIAVSFGDSPNYVAVSALSFTGVVDTSALDQVNSRSATNSQSWTSGSITPSEANTVVVGCFFSGGGADSRSTPDSGWTDAQDLDLFGNRVITYQVVPDTAARNPSGAFASSQAGATQIGITVNYKAVASSTNYHTKMSLLHVG